MLLQIQALLTSPPLLEDNKQFQMILCPVIDIYNLKFSPTG